MGKESEIPLSSVIRGNRLQTLTFGKIFVRCKHTFSDATRAALSNHHEKTKKYSDEIFICGYLTYAINT
jgi:hypothetical protein